MSLRVTGLCVPSVPTTDFTWSVAKYTDTYSELGFSRDGAPHSRTHLPKGLSRGILGSARFSR